MVGRLDDWLVYCTVGWTCLDGIICSPYLQEFFATDEGEIEEIPATCFPGMDSFLPVRK